MFWTCISRRERTSMVNTKYNLWATTKPRVDFLMSDDSPFDIKCWLLFIYHIGRKYSVSKSMCYFGGVFYMSRLSSHAFNKNNNETTISALLLLPLLCQSYVDIYVYMQSRNIGQSHIACSFYPTMTPHLVLYFQQGVSSSVCWPTCCCCCCSDDSQFRGRVHRWKLITDEETSEDKEALGIMHEEAFT